MPLFGLQNFIEEIIYNTQRNTSDCNSLIWRFSYFRKRKNGSKLMESGSDYLAVKGMEKKKIPILAHLYETKLKLQKGKEEEYKTHLNVPSKCQYFFDLVNGTLS